jgi:hypothetical protein
MPGRALSFNENTWEALRELADITEIQGDDRFRGLVQDALRVYEWVVYQQATGHFVASLEAKDMAALQTSNAVDGKREVLDPMFPEKMLDKARHYFEKAA